MGGADILTYGRASGLFAGMSLSGASLSPDDDVNERLYGKGTTARDIVLGGTVKTPTGGERLVSLLNSKIPKRTSKSEAPSNVNASGNRERSCYLE